MTHTPEHMVVWAEIPVRDMAAAQTFYESVFLTSMAVESNAPNPMVNFVTASPGGVAGHIYPGEPASDGRGPTIHLACPDTLEQTLDRVKAAGGTVLSDAIQIPPGRFAYCRDLDGNSIGVFEASQAA